MKKKFSDEDIQYGETTWHNDLDVPVTFKLLINTGSESQRAKFRTVKVPAKGSVTLSSEYDGSVRLERDGVVQGGLAPTLRKDGEKRVNLHSSLDFLAVKERLELEKLAEEIAKENALKDALRAQAEKKASKGA